MERVEAAAEPGVVDQDLDPLELRRQVGQQTLDVVCPAQLTAAETAAVQEMALRAFTAVEGEGLARVDFFLTSEGPVVNELNTMPGFTPISMFPKCWIASGMSYGALISELIEIALDRAPS